MSIHPIEVESYRILEGRVDLSHHDPFVAAVIARTIHATADLDFAGSMRVTRDAVEAGVEAIASGAPVIVDVEMVRAGITAHETVCCLRDVAVAPDGWTRSAAAMRVAAERHPEGAIVVVGCAPTALVEAVRLVDADELAPALLIGVPVGFVGAAEAKDRAHFAPVPSITNIGEKGGSAVAAAVLNAVVSLQPTNGRR